MKYTSSLLICMLLAPSAFAQFKVPAQAAVNAAQFERILAQSTLKKLPAGSYAVHVPERVIPAGKTVLTSRAIPAQITPANHSFYVTVEQTMAQLAGIRFKKQDITKMMGALWSHSTRELAAFGKGFYTDQSALARDLDRFYGGKETLRQAPDGRHVKFYALPVEGILYQPAEYKTPVVLNTKDYFVIYDVDHHTGQIVRDIPALYSLYTPCSFPQLMAQLRANYQEQKILRDSGKNDLLWESIGGERTYNEAEILLARDVVEFYRQRARLNALRRSGLEGTDEELINLTPSKYQAHFEPEAPLVRDQLDGQEGYVLELPIDGLRYMVNRLGAGLVLNPQHYVVFYVPGKTSVIMERDTIEDPSLFGPVTQGLVEKPH